MESHPDASRQEFFGEFLGDGNQSASADLRDVNGIVDRTDSMWSRHHYFCTLAGALKVQSQLAGLPTGTKTTDFSH